MALRLAARGRYRAAPNPMVGAVVVREGEPVGTGWHRGPGSSHAEVVALQRAGERARGATVYVTLEPCCHFGRTPPCVEALVAAGVRRVVACHRDPNPVVAGKGLSWLAREGIEVDVGVLAPEAVRQNLSYLVPHLLGRPAVTLKWAMSLDGKIATAGGESQWLSAPEGRRWGLALREEHDAVLVGIGTALADDPRLDRRLGLAPGAGLRVVLDRRLRLPLEARLLAGGGEALVYTASRDAARRSALEARGATVVTQDAVRPETVLSDLRARGVRSVLVEGGAAILGAFFTAGAYDRVAVDCAPLLVGGREAPSPIGGDGVLRLEDAPRLEGLRVGRRGGDLVISGLRAGCLRELCERVVG